MSDNESEISNVEVIANNIAPCFLIPPLPERPFSSWRAIVFNNGLPSRVFDKTRILPSKLTPNLELMKGESERPDRIFGFVIQLNGTQQYVHIEGESYEIIGTDIGFLNGYPNQDLNLNFDYNSDKYENVYVVDLTFKTHFVKDQNIQNQIVTLIESSNQGVV